MIGREPQSWAVISTVIVALSLLTGCAHISRQRTSSLQEYLYPKDAKTEAVRNALPRLSSPLQMGIVFVPETTREMTGTPPKGGVYGEVPPLSEKEKTELIEAISSRLRTDAFFKSIEIIPSTYLSKGGSFANLDQVRTMAGVDVIALLSYDQVQFTDEGLLAFLYWTGMGWFFVPGEKNETNTLVDVAVYHAPSRTLLFRGLGQSQITGRTTPVHLSGELRKDSAAGFKEAAHLMIGNLQQQIELYKRNIQ